MCILWLHIDVNHVPTFSNLVIFFMIIGLSFVVDQLACSYIPTACFSTMRDQICMVSCKPLSFLATWLVFAMVSFSCSALSVSELL